MGATSKLKHAVVTLRGYDVLSEDRQQRLGFVLETGLHDQRWAAFNCLHEFWLVGHYPTANEAIKAVVEFEEHAHKTYTGERWCDTDIGAKRRGH